MFASILTRLRVHSIEYRSKVKYVQVIKSSSNDDGKPKMFNKLSNPLSGKDISENKSTSVKCRFCSSSGHTAINYNV